MIINLNDKVRVKVLQRGRVCLQNYGLGHLPPMQEPGSFELEIPLWEAFRIFGHDLFLGFDQPIDPNIELLTPELPEVKQMRLGKDDTIVLKFNRAMSTNDCERVIKLMEEKFPGQRVLVLDQDVNVEILKKQV